MSATGSAGTIGAGDRLKERYGARIVAVEALECPTLLENGFGEHNIQGIGDKHVPLIHNVMNTDVVVAVSDRATDELDVLFNTDAGRAYLVERRGVDAEVVDRLRHFGFSSICNVLSAIKTAKLLGLGPDDAVITIATDGAGLYGSERAKTLAGRFGGTFGDVDAAEVFAEHLASVGTDHIVECTEQDRNRIFNLGYYTWVEQQDTPLEVFEARRSQHFWRELREPDRGVGRADRRVQRSARGRSPTRDHRLPLCGLRGRGAGGDAVAVAVSERHRRPTAITCMFRVRPPAPVRFGDDPNPLVAFDSLYAWAAFAEAHGMGADDRAKLVRSLDEAVTAVDGVGFVVTPFAHSRPLSEALGFSRDGGVLVKDDTGNVAGSHKARHLAGILLHLLAAEQLGVAPVAERPPLAIASCGNAALAAATLARAVGVAGGGVRTDLGRGARRGPPP